MTKQEQPFYVSPQMEAIEIKTQAMICQSGGNNSMEEIYYGTGGFEEDELIDKTE